MAESEQRNKENCIVGSKEMMVKQEKRENTLTNGGKGSGDDADSLEELPLDIGEHYLVRRSDDSWHPAEIIQTRYNESESHYEYYVHYEGHNRRLDEWVPRDRIMSSRFDMSDRSWKSGDRNSGTDLLADSSDRKITRNQKKKT